MSPRDFTFWAHGWSEINGGGAPNALQWQIIVDHLNLVLSEREVAEAFREPTPDGMRYRTADNDPLGLRHRMGAGPHLVWTGSVGNPRYLTGTGAWNQDLINSSGC